MVEKLMINGLYVKFARDTSNNSDTNLLCVTCQTEMAQIYMFYSFIYLFICWHG